MFVAMPGEACTVATAGNDLELKEEGSSPYEVHAVSSKPTPPSPHRGRKRLRATHPQHALDLNKVSA